MSEKVLVSGVKPTGELHIGNYFGAIRQMVEMANAHESFIFMADYHAITSYIEPQQLTQNILDLAAAYIALGLNPDKVTFFQQSRVSAHTELSWIFSCLASMPYLMRAHAFKDAEAKNKEISVGTFNYPVLMAADILLYDADVVPVGQDQAQHLEIARDMARKFNDTYGTLFKEPQAIIREEVAVVPGTDGRKMSKSYGNVIPLFASDDVLRKAVMGIVTTSKAKGEPLDPDTCNVFAMYKLFLNGDELNRLSTRYREGSIGYGEAKENLYEIVRSYVAPFREKRSLLLSDRIELVDILNRGAEKAQAQAQKKVAHARQMIGLTI